MLLILAAILGIAWLLGFTVFHVASGAIHLLIVLAVIAAIAVGGGIGFLYALLLNRFGMPSFVSTLAGLLAVLGLQLYILGDTGSINLPYGSPLVSFGQTMTMPHVLAYVVAALAGLALFATGYRTASRRRAAR